MSRGNARRVIVAPIFISAYAAKDQQFARSHRGCAGGLIPYKLPYANSTCPLSPYIGGVRGGSGCQQITFLAIHT